MSSLEIKKRITPVRDGNLMNNIHIAGQHQIKKRITPVRDGNFIFAVINVTAKVTLKNE